VQRVCHGLETQLGVFRHNVDLDNLFGIVQDELHEIRLGKSAFFLFQLDRHRRTENGQAFVEPDHFLFVQPQQRQVQQFGRLLYIGHQYLIGFNSSGELSQRGFRQEIGAALPLRQTIQKMGQQVLGGGTAQPRGFFQCTPIPLQRHLYRFGIDVF